MIEAKNISYHTLTGKKILSDVSFKANVGELIVIIGPNGAGKSTLLKLLSGSIKPSLGEIMFMENKLDSYSDKVLAKHRAMLSQFNQISDDFTVKEVVTMGRFVHYKHNPRKLDNTIINKALEYTKVTHLKNRIMNTLSGGEQQRVHLARVLAQIWREDDSPSKLLMLDEPVNGLDVHHQHNILQLAKEKSRNEYCVIAVLHDLNLAALYADRIILLNNSAIECIGSTEVVLEDDLLQRVYEAPLKVNTINNNLNITYEL